MGKCLLGVHVFGPSKEMDVCASLYHWLTNDFGLLFFGALITQYVLTAFKF